jgi:hypothetical protein
MALKNNTPSFTPLQLDFARHSQRASSAKGVGAVLLIAGALGLGFGALQLKQAYDTRTEQQARATELNARMQSFKEQTANAARSRKADAADPLDNARSRAAKQAATELQMPWAELLSALEAAPTQNVAVLSIEPSAARRNVKLTAEAKDAKAMLTYLAALQKDARLNQVMLTQHQVQSQTAGTPLRFQLQAYWGGGFAGAPDVVPTNVNSPGTVNNNTPMMADNAAQNLPQAEQNAIANQMGNTGQAIASPQTAIAARTAPAQVAPSSKGQNK